MIKYFHKLKLWYYILCILVISYGLFSLFNYQNSELVNQSIMIVSKYTSTYSLKFQHTHKESFDGQITNNKENLKDLHLMSTLASKHIKRIVNDTHFNHNSSRGKDYIIDPNMFAIYNLLPHLRGNFEQPKVVTSNSRKLLQSDFVIGVPSAKRDGVNYLTQTLRSLIMALNAEHRKRVLIVVYLSGLDQVYVEEQTLSLNISFKREIRSGLLEIVSPPQSFYPNFETFTPTLGDSKERMSWRTKQVLDIIFLLVYAYGRSKFYLQLEDDVISKNNFLTVVNQVISQQDREWGMMDFCRLGFIGKLFHNADLLELAVFFTLFYRDKPVDWLLQDYFQTKYCDPDHKHKCHNALERHIIFYEPPLFQHVGTKSSLTGKIQKLQVKNFEKILFLEKHQNPAAILSTTLTTYEKYDLQGAYQRKSIFWGTEPEIGDTIIFQFQPPIHIAYYRIKSCHERHVSDCFYDTTLEVKPERGDKLAEHSLKPHDYSAPPGVNETTFNESLRQGYLILNLVDHVGTLEGSVPTSLGPIQSMRLKIHSTSPFWITISEIYIKATEAKDHGPP